MNERFARDIMVPLAEYPCIPETHTLRQAIEEMRKAQILRDERASLPRMALVFDKSLRELRGMLRRRDIMKGLEPRFLTSGSLDYPKKLFNTEVDPNLSELTADKVAARIRARADRLVKDYMSPIRATVRHDDHIMKVIYGMVDKNTSLVPVLKNDDVIGVIRSVEILDEVAAILGG
jgi:CBS domain-containing protein